MHTPKKILIVSEYFYPEEFKINEIALAWKNRGHEVDVITQNPTYPMGQIYTGYENRWVVKESYMGINIYRVKAVSGYKESLLKKLLKYFTFMILGSFVSLRIGKKYDAVFGFDVGALSGMVPAILLQKFYKKRVTLWVQDIWPDSVYAYGFKKSRVLEFFLNHFVKFVYKNCSNFAISAKGFESKIRPFLNEEKEIRYLPNWADALDVTLDSFTYSQEKKVHFTFAGNVGKVQNLDAIILACGTLKEDLRDKLQLNILGDGSHLEHLKKLVEENQLKNTLFWGQKPRSEIYKYLRASDFLIVSLMDKPIFSLTVPAKTQTYIAANKPIFGVIQGETADLIREYNLGFCTQEQSIEAIQALLIQALQAGTAQIEAFTKNSTLLTHTLFDKEQILSSLLDLLLCEKR